MDLAIRNIQELVDKVEQLKKQDKMDPSSDQDLSVALMNLISIEEHLFFTGAKTGKAEYYDILNEVRSVRKDLLKKIVKEYEGEVWCISKHLLAASMRLDGGWDQESQHGQEGRGEGSVREVLLPLLIILGHQFEPSRCRPDRSGWD
jgi:hypothetical protein